MRPSYEDLEEHVAFLRSELGVQVHGDKIARIRQAYRATNSTAHMILRLYEARGKPVSVEQLLESLPSPSKSEDRSLQLVAVFGVRVREALGGQDTLENVRSFGYRLSDDARARVAIVLGDAPESHVCGFDIRALEDKPSEELRELTARIAGILAFRDEDGGLQVATIYRRIADRLTGQPRVAA